MSIPQPTFNPPFNIVRISHTEWGVTDMDYARDFYVNMLGYICEDDLGDALYLRGLEERNHHSLVLVKADEPSVHRIAFKVASEEDLDRAEAFFASKGSPTTWVNKYAQGRTLHVNDPFGVPLELYYKMEHRELLLQQYTRYSGARIQRIDHVNLFSHDVNAATKFYVSELGFRVTEATVADINDPTSDLWATWMHRRGGVHDIAFTNGTGPRQHHIAVYISTPMDIINFCDRLASSQYISAFERGPGRHGISNAFFLYILDQDGHRIELFANDYMTVDPDHPPRVWDLLDPQRQTLWGQAAPRSWFEHGSAFTGLETQPASLGAKPIIAPE
ncbi:MAG: 3,4-dihydroxyphenylacetate 2,3-dioxygenase [Ardenticatenaceae bacterium]